MTETRSWTIPAAAPITFDATKYILTTSSVANMDDKVYAVTLTEAAVYGGNTFSANVAFSITVTDSCLTTVITPFTVASFSLENGKTNTANFNEPTDSAATAVSKPTICGARSYQVLETISGSDVAQTIVTVSTITAGVEYKLTTTTMQEA